MPEFGNGAGVVGLGEVAAIGASVDEDEAGDGEVALMEGLDGEEGVVDGAESGTGGDENGELKFGHEIEHGFLSVEGNEGTAGAFDEEALCMGAEGMIGVD